MEDYSVAIMGVPGGTKKAGESPLLLKGSRAHFQAFYNSDDFPKEVKDKVENGALKLTDRRFYSTREVNSDNLKMFQSDDLIISGIRNVQNGQLRKDELFVLSYIDLHVAWHDYGTDSPTDAEIKSALRNGIFYGVGAPVPLVRHFTKNAGGNLAEISDGEAVGTGITSIVGIDEEFWAGWLTGEITLNFNGKPLLRDFPLLDLAVCRDGIYGRLPIENPRIFEDQQDIDFTIKFGGGEPDAGAQAAFIARVTLGGTGLIAK